MKFIDQDILKPSTLDAQSLAEWEKCVVKVRQIILEGARDHIVSSLHGMETPYVIWKSLMDLYQNNIDQRKLAPKDKLRKNKMEKGDTTETFIATIEFYGNI